MKCKICGMGQSHGVHISNFWGNNICANCYGSANFSKSRTIAKPHLDKIKYALDELQLLSIQHDWAHVDPPLYSGIMHMLGNLRRSEQMVIDTLSKSAPDENKEGAETSANT